MLDSPLDSARLQEIYSRTAAFYDQVVAEHQAAAKLEAIDMLRRRESERFLEVAVGTGWAFTRALQRGSTALAYGTDVAPGMLEVARDRLREDHERAPALLLADAGRLPFRDEAFDCLLCTYTLECMPAPLIDATLAEMWRVLHRGGRVVLADLTEGEAEDAEMTEEWKSSFLRDPEFFGGARPLRLRPLLEAHAFILEERRYSGHGSGWPSEIVLARRA